MNKIVLLAFVLVLLSTAVVWGFMRPTVAHTNEINSFYGHGKSVFASSKTIWVPDNFTSIQEAINNASDGDKIYVRNGTYYENIFINKTISLNGENPETTIIDGSKSNDTFSPLVYLYGENAKDVRICNFTVRRSNNAWGIFITFHANAWIEKNIIANNSGGIVADFSDNNTFVNNTVINNKFEGILFFDSSENIMRNNTISGNSYNFGILRTSFNNDIDISNLVNGKPIYYMKNCSDLSINPSTFPNVGYLALINCTNVSVESLNLTNNYNGFLLVDVKNSTVKNNTFENNLRGIELIDSSNNTMESNNVTDNNWIGISLLHSPKNRFRENNLLNNQLNFKVSGDYLSEFLQDIDLSNAVDGKTIRYLINYTDLAVNPSTLDNTGYLAFVNCYNITAENFSLENSELLFAFTQNSSIIKNTITSGGISLAYSSFINLTGNLIMNGESGISIYHSENCTIAKNDVVQNWEYGIYLQASSDNTLFCNGIKSNDRGIWLSGSSDNTIYGNNITDNRDYGIILLNSSYNKIFHNNFISNAIPQWQAVSSLSEGNNWYNGYPSGGNYWSDYADVDLYSGPNQDETGSDGIGDKSYIFGPGPLTVHDRYPLMGPISFFNAGTWNEITYDVHTVSNSTVSDFYFSEDNKLISFNVTGTDDTVGFCRVTIPKELLWSDNPEQWQVRVNNTLIEDRKIMEDTNYAYIYFTYNQSTQNVEIIGVYVIPEFPTGTSMLIMLIVLTVTIAICKRRLFCYS